MLHVGIHVANIDDLPEIVGKKLIDGFFMAFSLRKAWIVYFPSQISPISGKSPSRTLHPLMSLMRGGLPIPKSTSILKN